MTYIGVGKCYRGGKWGAIRRVDAMVGGYLEWYGETFFGGRHLAKCESPIELKTFARWAREEVTEPEAFKARPLGYRCHLPELYPASRRLESE